MRPLTPLETIILALAEFSYLTAEQVCRLLYAQGSIKYVKALLKSLVDAGSVLPLAGRSLNLPRVYTLTGKGRKYAALLGKTPVKQRFRATEEREKEHNLYFIRHTLAVIDVLINARLLSHTHPGILLTRLYQEHELKGKLCLPVHLPGQTRQQNIVLVPDAALAFSIQDAWQDFVYLEVYRNFPAEGRFKQKIAAYVALAHSPQQQELFGTDALSVAMLATPPILAQTLKTWTEEALTSLGTPEEGERFFFSSIDPATATPQAMYLLPVWRQAFGTVPTPLLVLEEERQALPSG